MKVVSKGDQCSIKLENREGERMQIHCTCIGLVDSCIIVPAGELFAVCPVDSFPGVAVEPVSDSSRYFVLRLQDQEGKYFIVLWVPKPPTCPHPLLMLLLL